MNGKLLTRAAMLIAALSIAAAGHAATICVSDTAATCEATLADAIAAASAGDTISIRSGVYFENVTVPAGLDGLRIVGPSTAILDAGDDGVAAVPNTGVAIAIQADDVEVQGITIRNGDDYHIELADGVTGTLVNGVRSINADDAFVYSAGVGNHGTTVRDCTVHASDGAAVDVDGDDVTVLRNHIANMSDGGVDIEGNNALVEGNVLIGIENDDPIYVSGDNAEVVRNRISASDYEGVEVSGDNAMVARNRMSGVYEGIYVDGDSPTVIRNMLTGVVAGGYAVELYCDVCTDGSVSWNRVMDVGDDTYAFYIDATNAGLTIANNLVWDVIDYGFDLDINGATVRNNRVVRAGGDEEVCFYIDGDGNTVENNVAQYCMGHGFEIYGDDNSFTGNASMNAGESGFYVTGGSNNNTLTRNRALDNGLIGFRVSDGAPAADGTVLDGNRASGNHSDLCDEGTNTTLTNNSFGTVLTVPQDGVVDCPVD